MATYILRRCLQMGVMLILLSMVIFSLIAVMPGDPVDNLITSDPSVKPEDVARLRARYGLDDPIYLRYFKWVKQVVVDRDLGFSRVYKQPASKMIGDSALKSLQLMGMALLVSLCIAIPVGTLAAYTQYGFFDYLVTFVAFVGISIPAFWLGIMVILVVGVTLRGMGIDWFRTSPPPDGAGLIELARFLVLPVFVLVFERVGEWSRYVRSSMLEVLQEDYIRTARAKGASELKVVLRHGLANALIPVVTIVALSIPSLFGGALITETVFAWPGMGRLLYTSVMQNDYYVAVTCFMILAALTLLFTLVADLLYAYLDPRIRLG